MNTAKQFTSIAYQSVSGHTVMVRCPRDIHTHYSHRIPACIIGEDQCTHMIRAPLFDHDGPGEGEWIMCPLTDAELQIEAEAVLMNPKSHPFVSRMAIPPHEFMTRRVAARRLAIRKVAAPHNTTTGDTPHDNHPI